jgi:acetylornithine deacetylase/succinyl-diaminopimelate desuccinylase-like protein
MKRHYPPWVLEESHPAVQAAVETGKQLTGVPPAVGKWLFSTNGVGSMGICGVPTIGFGPGDEADAHTVNERVAIEHLVLATQFYAAFPLVYVHMAEHRKSVPST